MFQIFSFGACGFYLGQEMHNDFLTLSILETSDPILKFEIVCEEQAGLILCVSLQPEYIYSFSLHTPPKEEEIFSVFF